MRCNRCGANLADDAKFCNLCGGRVDGSSANKSDEVKRRYSFIEYHTQNLFSIFPVKKQ